MKLRDGLAPPFGTLAAAWLFLGLLIPIALSYGRLNNFGGTEAHFLLFQDLPAFAPCVLIVAALGWAPRTWLAAIGARAFVASTWLPVLAVICVAFGAAAAWLVFDGYVMSLDEFLTDFDARIFTHGASMAPVAPAWRSYVPALQPMFVLPTPHHELWASAYLPINAGLRALAGAVGLAWLVNPALSAFAIIATYAAGRQLWPDRPGIALAAAALLATSSQLLLMAGTAYAMPGHLAFNLAWLWLFLRGGRLSHVAALGVGFVVSGLHQLMFHPLFVAPFILQLWLDRRWRLAAFYTAGYAAIALFWVEYYQIELSWLGAAARDVSSVGGGWFADRIIAIGRTIQVGALGAMAESLLRFVTWQSPLTAPLALIGALAAVKAKGHLRALTLGVAATLVAMLLLEPTQTHGWGYRYLHGLLGSICLLAAWTWARLTDGLTAESRIAARGGFVAACALSLLMLTPWRAWQAATYVRPYAAANALVQHAPEPVVFVDDREPWFDSGAVMRNDPFLLQGPKVLSLGALDAAQVSELCTRGPVGYFDGRQAGALGIETIDGVFVDPQLPRLRALMAQLRCGRPLDVQAQPGRGSEQARGSPRTP
jgi:hypothetical protein